MNESPTGASSVIDINIPNVARVYDFLLGGGHNFAADRQLASMIERSMPHVRDVVRLNRAFLRRAVLFMIDAGIRQFLDIGSGIPTVGNVHEIAQAADPRSRVVYVDKEPVAVAHSQTLLQNNHRAVAIKADIRDPEDILGRAETRDLLNLDEPVGLLTLLVWHFISDSDDPVGLLARYREALAPGSYLALSHVTDDDEPQGLEQARDDVSLRSREETFPRTHKQVVDLFAGFELVDPGVVGCAAWRPGGPGDFSQDSGINTLLYAGVGRKPAPYGMDG